MLTLDAVIDILNTQRAPENVALDRARAVYYGISLHTTGAAPAFKINDTRITPANWFGKEYQALFDNYLMSRHPREDEATRQWRYSQYRPFTKDPFIRIIEIVTGAIFQDSNYTIELKNAQDNAFVWGNSFNGYDIAHYFEWALTSVFEDPNGYFVRIPRQSGAETTTPRIEPDIWFVNTKDIIVNTPDELVFERGNYVWLINKFAIFRFQKVENKWVNADSDGYFAHNFGYIPADIAGGIWNSQGFYDSWLSKAKAAADDYISAKSAEQLVDKEASHPFIIQAQEDCPTCQATGRITEECDTCPGGYEQVKCGDCGGSGKMSNNPGQRLLAPKEDMDKRLIQIVNPDVNINKNHREKTREIMLMLMDALHLLRVEEAQSGVAKAIDQERLYQFISKISNDLFDRVIWNSVRDIIAYRSTAPASNADFTIIKPSQFQIKTAADLIEDYKQTKEAGVPTYIRARLMVDFVDKQFGGDFAMKRKAEVIAELDPIATATVDEKQAMVLSGAITQRDWQFSALLPSLLDGLIRERGKEAFLRMQFEALKAEIERRFNERLPAPIPLMNEE